MKRVLIAAIIVQVLFFAVFYPKTYAIYDEDIYLTTANAMEQGTVFYDEADISEPFSGTLERGGHTFSKYPPGNSALLVPFTSIHWRLGFIRNIVLYFASFVLLVFILKNHEINPLYSLLFLFHPSILLFSRTVMSDIPSMFFVILGIFLISRRKFVASGFSLGFLLLLRYPNTVLAAGIFLGLIVSGEKKGALKTLYGIGFFAAILMAYLLHAFGTVLGPFSIGDASGFNIKYLLRNAGYYFMSMNILYPGMLIIAFVYGFRKKFLSIIIPSIMLISLYLFYYYIEEGMNFIHFFIKGQRFMLPVLPLLFIPYFKYLQKKFRKEKILLYLIPVFLVISFLVNWRHQTFLNRQNIACAKVLDFVGGSDCILCDAGTDELLNPYFLDAKCVEINRNNLLKLGGDKENVPAIITALEKEKKKEEIDRAVFLLQEFGYVKTFETFEPYHIMGYIRGPIIAEGRSKFF